MSLKLHYVHMACREIMLVWFYFQLWEWWGMWDKLKQSVSMFIIINQYFTQCNRVFLRCFRALLDNYGALKHRWKGCIRKAKVIYLLVLVTWNKIIPGLILEVTSSFTSDNRSEALKLLLMLQYRPTDGITDVNKRVKTKKGKGVSTQKRGKQSSSQILQGSKVIFQVFTSNYYVPPES